MHNGPIQSFTESMESSDSDHEDFNRLFENQMKADVSIDETGDQKKLTKIQQLAGTVRCDIDQPSGRPYVNQVFLQFIRSSLYPSGRPSVN